MLENLCSFVSISFSFSPVRQRTNENTTKNHDLSNTKLQILGDKANAPVRKVYCETPCTQAAKWAEVNDLHVDGIISHLDSL